jgi:hypothetical protein
MRTNWQRIWEHVTRKFATDAVDKFIHDNHKTFRT